MTIVMNEIRLLDGLNKSFIIFAADRRISKLNGKYDSTRKKLFRIEYLEGGVSYFGLAQVFPNGREIYLSDWLPNFIRNQSDVSDLEEFSNRLRNKLSKIVPSSILQNCPSGFHIAGYTPSGYPDFYYFSNIGSSENFRYSNLHQEYGQPASHFLSRDASIFGWDGSGPSTKVNGYRVYRNGEISGHSVAWERLDDIFIELFKFGNFNEPSTLQEYEKFVRTKLEMIAYMYRKFAKRKIIDRPLDVFSYSRM